MFYNHFEKKEKGSLVASDCLVLYYLFSISFVDSNLWARNEEVYAMMPGEVVKVSSDKRSGNYVSIRHEDYTVSYYHLSKALVKKGARVTPGEVVAISGNTRRSTAPHLHLTAKYGKKHIDPAILLQFVRETREEALAHLVAGN